MAWPTNIDNTFTGNASANISDARSELNDNILATNDIIDSRGEPNGIAALNANGKLTTAELPTTYATTANQALTLNPDNDRVNIQKMVNLTPQSTTEIENFPNPLNGDVAFCIDGDAGSPCVAVYDGTNWTRISLGAAISTT